MKIILKILFIAVVGLFVGNAECTQAPVQQPQTVFDLPGNTPGLLSDRPNRSVCGQQKTCVHVIVPGSEAERVFLSGNSDDNEQEAIESASYKGGNIYFPVDGSQPTTEDAVKWSCANVDNRENSSVTEWYMKMFGVVDIHGGNSANDDYVKARWSAPSEAINAQRIISFDATVDDTLVDDPNIHGSTISRRALFKREFRKIASTSVGRVLLYRILIEIGRRQKNNEGCTESQIVLSASNVFVRNTCRNLRIVYRDGDFAFRPQGELAFSNAIADETVIGGAVRGTGYSKVILCPDTVSVSLFHEMLHWYHHLRNVDRIDPLRNEIFDI